MVTPTQPLPSYMTPEIAVATDPPRKIAVM
jgi:hypothetical protein